MAHLRQGSHLRQGYGGQGGGQGSGHAGGQAAPVVKAERLTRVFNERVAVRDLTLSVHAGEVVALLGPNGAGKTTTMRMLAGLILPTSGRISVNRVEISATTADEARHSIGLLTESPGLWDRLSVRLNLLTFARLQGLGDASKRVDEILKKVDLFDRRADAAGTLSKGLKQRVAIARALLHRPPVVLLDEPTAGLDPESARRIRDLIGELRSEGRAVLVSTHNLVEADELSDRIAILNTDLLACDSSSALRKPKAGLRVVIELEGATPATVQVNDASEIPDVIARLVADGARIVRVAPEERSLEDVYLELVGAAR